MKTFEEAWERIKRDYPELTASSYNGLSLSRTKELIKNVYDEFHNEHNEENKTICVNCIHYSKECEDDACFWEVPDYVYGGMRKVCDLCRSKNTDGKCKDYKEQTR